MALLLSTVLFLPLIVGVWLPDVALAPRHVLAEELSKDGQALRVVQFWNGVDFYTTQLEYKSEDGTSQVFILDGDDSKSWSVPMAVDWTAKKAKVTLGGGRVRTVNWIKRTIQDR